MHRLSALIVLVSAPAFAGGAPTNGINWFTIGDPHSIAMGWFIINFLVFAAGFAFVMKTKVLPAANARADRFEDLLKASERAREAAEAKQNELQARLDGMNDEIAALRAETDVKLDEEKKMILDSAQAEIDRMQKTAEIALERSRRAAQRRLATEAAELAFAAATKRVGEVLEAADHDRLNNEFVSSVEGEA